MLVSEWKKALIGALAALLLPDSVRAATIDVSALSTDSSAASANALAINAAIATANSGDTVQLPAGTYAIGTTIQLKTGVNLAGVSQTQTSLQYAGSVSQPILTDNGASNLQLKDFTLDGASSVNASEGIAAQNCSGLNIQGVTVQNLTLNSDPNAEIGPQGIYFSGTVTSSIIASSTFKNIGTNSSWGAGIRLSAGSDNNQILNNTVANTGRGGILLSESPGNTIVGNTVSGSGVTTAGLGIEVQDSANSLIQSNTVDHWISVDTSSGSAVRGNTVSDTSGTFKLAGLELVDSQNVVFSHNVVNGGAEVGISISGNAAKSQVYFGHNLIKGSNTWGAQLQGGTGGASEFYFEQNTFTETTASATGLYANQGYGFRFNGDAHFITLDNTNVTSNQGEAVQVSGGNLGNLTFNNTLIKNNGGQAVDQDNGLQNVTWSNTTATNNGSSGTANFVPASTGNAPLQMSVTIDAPTTVTAGQVANFTAILNEAGGSIAHVLWDFGDGLPATTSSAAYTFSTPGTYNVAVVVWDQSGQGSEAEFNVDVSPEPSSAALLGVAVAGMLLTRRRRRSPLAISN